MSFYNNIPIGLLADFYVEIQNNLHNGTLTQQMNRELKLIRKAAIVRGVNLDHLQQHSKRRKVLG